MDVLNNILGTLGLGAITEAVNDVTGLINTLFPAEPSFLEKLEGFFGGMSDVFTQLGAINIDFSAFSGVIDAVSKLFGA